MTQTLSAIAGNGVRIVDCFCVSYVQEGHHSTEVMLCTQLMQGWLDVSCYNACKAISYSDD